MAKLSITLDESLGHHGKIVKYYRCAVINPPRGWTQEQLAEAMGVSPRWVQEIEKMAYIQDMNRRKALAVVLSIPVAFLNIDNLEQLAENSLIELKPTMLQSLENEVRSRWQMYYSSSNHATEKGLLEQIEVLEQLADNDRGNGKQLACLLSQNYQIAGTLARDNFKYSRAKKYFKDARDYAKEAQSPDLMAAAVARHALVLLRQERKEEALLLYQEATDLVKNAQPLVRGYIYAGLAEALARQGLPDDCYRMLDVAEKYLSQTRNDAFEDDLAFVRLTFQSLQDKRGECYVLAGQPWKGIEYLQRAEKSFDHNGPRNHCRLLLQQAEAFFVAGEADTCVEYALEGLQIAQMLGSAGNINWVSEIYKKLLASSWGNEPVVGKLGVAIVTK